MDGAKTANVRNVVVRTTAISSESALIQKRNTEIIRQSKVLK